MEINYGDGWLPSKEMMDYMNRAAGYLLEQEGIVPDLIEISVTFVTAEEIKDLNELHKNIDEVTDVLSFPQYENKEIIIGEIEDEKKITTYEEIHITLGDVVICMDRVKEQAESLFHSIERELTYLFTHSLLHLLGYNHEDEDERAEMRKIENIVMDEVGLGRKKR